MLLMLPRKVLMYDFLLKAKDLTFGVPKSVSADLLPGPKAL